MKLFLSVIFVALIYPGSCMVKQARAQQMPTDPVRLNECENLRDDALAQAGQWQNLAATLSKKNRTQQLRVDEMERQIAELQKQLANHKGKQEEKK
jgi:hypothetical protein